MCACLCGCVLEPVRAVAARVQYLDSQISPMDIYYLEDQDLARQLVELGVSACLRRQSGGSPAVSCSAALASSLALAAAPVLGPPRPLFRRRTLR